MVRLITNTCSLPLVNLVTRVLNRFAQTLSKELNQANTSTKLLVMCRVFHRHALVICRNCYWCTFEIKSNMDIHEVLDACDLHLIYIHLGIFASLRLKQRHSAKISPPEFPAWTSHGGDSSESSPTSVHIDTSQLLDDNTLVYDTTKEIDSAINVGNYSAVNSSIINVVVPHTGPATVYCH